jgi:transcriptional regulator with XRE-family HTH domain
MDLIKIGKYIAAKRKALGLTQKQLAEKLNMSDKSVSKWERGICLPDVTVYLELCKILGISINEFLAGEDIPKETIEQKAEENIIQITKDNKNKQKYLKKIIRLLIVMLVVFIFITSIFIYKKLTQPQNYIEPYLEKSTEMQTANMLSSRPGNILLFHYNSKKNYDSLTMYLTQYQKGKKISHKEVCEFYINPSQGAKKGNIALTINQETSSMKIIVAYDGGYYSAEQISFLENIKDFDAWSIEKIEEKTLIRYGKEQMLAALFYGKEGVSTIPIEELEKKDTKLKNDYMCILSFKFK